VIGRDVQRREVVEVVLDLGTRVHVEARVAEDRYDAPLRTRDWVQLPRCFAAAGQRDVERVGRKLRGEVLRLERGAPQVDGRGERGLRVVDRFAGRGDLRGWELADLAQLRREQTLF